MQSRSSWIDARTNAYSLFGTRGLLPKDGSPPPVAALAALARSEYAGL
jgi:hypothetical protein